MITDEPLPDLNMRAEKGLVDYKNQWYVTFLFKCTSIPLLNSKTVIFF